MSARAAELLQNPNTVISAGIPTHLGPGEAAARSLCLRAVEMQRAWMEAHDIRHGRGTKRSMRIQDRCAQERFEEHGRPPLENGHELGDHLKLLFEYLLQHLNDSGYLQRCNQPHGPPRAATDALKFHRLHYRRFGEQNFNWATLPEAEQRRVLRSYLFMLWTTDPQKKVMRPQPCDRTVACQASWGAFWLSDAELDKLVGDAVCNYRVGAVHLFQ